MSATSPDRPAEVTLLRVRGVPVVVSPVSLLAGLVVAGSWYPLVDHVLASRATAVLGTVAATAVGALLSVLAHELAHGATGTALGRPPLRYELTLLGGRTSFGPAPRWSPGRDVLTSLAGPATNALLWLALGQAAGLAWLPVPVALTAWALSRVNLALAVLNVLPALPLDGGHALAALLHQLTGSRRLGQQAAAWGGVLVLAGTVWVWVLRPLVLHHRQPSATTLMVLVLVGWSLAQASWQVLGQGRAARAAARLDLTALARPVVTAPAHATLPSVRAALDGGAALVLVTDGPRLLGAVDAVQLAEAGLADPSSGQDVLAGQVCAVVPAAALATAARGPEAAQALARARAVGRWLLLLEGGRVSGAVPTGAR